MCVCVCVYEKLKAKQICKNSLSNEGVIGQVLLLLLWEQISNLHHQSKLLLWKLILISRGFLAILLECQSQLTLYHMAHFY